jgi:hypothetical protein
MTVLSQKTTKNVTIQPIRGPTYPCNCVIKLDDVEGAVVATVGVGVGANRVAILSISTGQTPLSSKRIRY